VLSALTVGAWAQSVTMDSLQQLTESLKGADSVAAKQTSHWHMPAHYTETADYDQAFAHLNKAQAALGSDLWTIADHAIDRQRGIAYTHQGNFGRAIELFARCKKYLWPTMPGCSTSPQLQSDIGYVFADLGNYEFSLKNYFEALAIAEANTMNMKDQTALPDCLGLLPPWAGGTVEQICSTRNA